MNFHLRNFSYIKHWKLQKKATPLILEVYQRVQNILRVQKLHALQLSHQSFALTKCYVPYLILVTSYLWWRTISVLPLQNYVFFYILPNYYEIILWKSAHKPIFHKECQILAFKSCRFIWRTESRGYSNCLSTLSYYFPIVGTNDLKINGSYTLFHPNFSPISTLFHPNFRIFPPRKQANDQHNRAVYY